MAGLLPQLAELGLRFGQTLGGGLAIPLHGFSVVFLDFGAAEIALAEVEFPVRATRLGRLAEPLDGLRVVLLHSPALEIAHAEVVLRRGKASFRRLPGMCTYLSPPEPFEILATDFEEWQRRNNTKTMQTVSSSSSGFTKDDHNSNPNKHQHRGRRGSGLKGNRTERMVEQLAEFKAWLRDNPVNERDAARTVGARAAAYWRLHRKTFDRDAARTGEKRGFRCAKTLASAYRNCKR